MIERTSSRRATLDSVEHELTKDQLDIAEIEEEKLRNAGLVPTYIYQPFYTRSPQNMIGMSIYRVLRVLYVSVWFYFLPFLTLLGSYYVPFWIQSAQALQMADS